MSRSWMSRPPGKSEIRSCHRVCQTAGALRDSGVNGDEVRGTIVVTGLGVEREETLTGPLRSYRHIIDLLKRALQPFRTNTRVKAGEPPSESEADKGAANNTETMGAPPILPDCCGSRNFVPLSTSTCDGTRAGAQQHGSRALTARRRQRFYSLRLHAHARGSRGVRDCTP